MDRGRVKERVVKFDVAALGLRLAPKLHRVLQHLRESNRRDRPDTDLNPDGHFPKRGDGIRNDQC